jgi:ABC-2 type transport system permease protein
VNQAVPAGPLDVRAARHPGLDAARDTLHAEWTKLRTVAGPAWLLAGVVAATVAVSAAASAAARCPAGTACTVDIPRLSLTGVQFGQALVVVLAVLMITGEFGTGMMRLTLTAMPWRSSVLAAKAVLLAGLVLAAGAVAAAGSVLAGRVILPGHGFTAARGFAPESLADAPTLRAWASPPSSGTPPSPPAPSWGCCTCLPSSSGR